MGPGARRGLFLVFEGVEGSGKSTQVERLAARLEAWGVPHRCAREPGGTAVGEAIRGLVLDPAMEPGHATELLLMLAARAEFVRRVVRPTLEAGELLVSDRYELSTLAYQGLARGLGLERVRRLNAFATGGLSPDLTLLLRLDPDEGTRRRTGGAADRMERQGRDFHRRVALAYDRLAAEEARVVAIEAGGSEEEVEARVLRALRVRWPETFGEGAGF